MKQDSLDQKATPVLLDLRELLDLRDHKVKQVSQDPKVTPELLDLQDRKARQDQQDHKEKKVTPDQQDP